MLMRNNNYLKHFTINKVKLTNFNVSRNFKSTSILSYNCLSYYSVQYSETQKSQQKAQSEIQRLKREFEEYKIKATTVLQVSHNYNH